MGNMKSMSYSEIRGETIEELSRCNTCGWKQWSEWDKERRGSVTTTYLLSQLVAVKYVFQYCIIVFSETKLTII